MTAVPAPAWGGTFFYCPWQEKIRGGLIVCASPRAAWAVARFRTARAYRRHWRKHHANGSQP